MVGIDQRTIRVAIGSVVAGVALLVIVRRSRRRQDAEGAAGEPPRGPFGPVPTWVGLLIVGGIVGLTSLRSGGNLRPQVARPAPTPPGSAWLQLVPPTLLLVLLMTFMVRNWLHQRRVRFTPQPAAPAPARRITPWVWLLLAAVTVLVTFLAQSGRPALPASEPGSSVLVWVALLGPMLVGGLIFFLILSQRYQPVVRAARRANRGDLAGAIAAIEVRVARRRTAIRAAASPASDNPYLAPIASPIVDAKLAEELNVLGVFESMRHDWTRALAYYGDAEATSASPIYRGNQGTALTKLGQAAAGVALLRRSITELPADDHLNRAQFLINAATGAIEANLLSEPEIQALLADAESAWNQVVTLSRVVKQPLKDEVDKLRAQLASSKPA